MNSQTHKLTYSLTYLLTLTHTFSHCGGYKRTTTNESKHRNSKKSTVRQRLDDPSLYLIKIGNIGLKKPGIVYNNLCSIYT